MCSQVRTPALEEHHFISKGRPCHCPQAPARTCIGSLKCPSPTLPLQADDSPLPSTSPDSAQGKGPSSLCIPFASIGPDIYLILSFLKYLLSHCVELGSVLSHWGKDSRRQSPPPQEHSIGNSLCFPTHTTRRLHRARSFHTWIEHLLCPGTVLDTKDMVMNNKFASSRATLLFEDPSGWSSLLPTLINPSSLTVSISLSTNIY